MSEDSRENVLENSQNIAGPTRMDAYKRSISPGATATKPKYVLEVKDKIAYFKFGLTPKEICAELMSYSVAEKLCVPIARAELATYKNESGIVSYDIGSYQEPDDSDGYSIKAYLDLPGFIEMILFDYLIMNEDRHAGNWGIQDGKVAPLFDHNVTFGAGAGNIADFNYFMEHLTFPFTIDTLYDSRANVILQYINRNYREKVEQFIEKLCLLEGICTEYDGYLNHQELSAVKNYLIKRIAYMKEVVAFG